MASPITRIATVVLIGITATPLLAENKPAPKAAAQHPAAVAPVGGSKVGAGNMHIGGMSGVAPHGLGPGAANTAPRDFGAAAGGSAPRSLDAGGSGTIARSFGHATANKLDEGRSSGASHTDAAGPRRFGGVEERRLGGGEEHRFGGAAEHRFGDRGPMYRGHEFARLHGDPYHWPNGYGYQRWEIGHRLPPVFWGEEYYVDYGAYGLEAPGPGFQWVRYGPDLLLVNIESGEIVQAVYGAYE